MRGRNGGGAEEEKSKKSGRIRGSGEAVKRRMEEKNKQMHLGVELAAQPRLVCQCVEDSVSVSR